MATSDRINPYRMFVGSFLPNWLLSRKELGAGPKLAYARLAQYAGKDGKAFPAIDTLAEELGKSTCQLYRDLKDLKTAGLIETEQRGLGQTNVYYFLRHAWMSDQDPSDMRDADLSDVRGQDLADMRGPTILRESGEENQKKRPRGGDRPSQEPPLPIPSRAVPAPLKVSSEFVSAQITAYADLWSETEVRQRIEEALNHKAARKWVHVELGVRNWLRRDAEAAKGRSNGSTKTSGAVHQDRPVDPDLERKREWLKRNTIVVPYVPR